jgi:CDP-6-deoxy-D-xylo-4-hexulose-3-dehydrase
MIKLGESSWGSEEIQAIQSCLDSDTLTMGSQVREFEIEFANFVGAKYALMVNSGSSANLLTAFVIRELRPVESRNTVIVPALSWATTYFPWIQAGYNLKFVDVDPINLNINKDDLRLALTDDVVGICMAHILGADAGISEVMFEAQKRNIWVVEDTCESLGALPLDSQSKSSMLGTFGLAGTYSFFRSHHISTMEGGMIVSDNRTFYEYCVAMRAHGWLRELPTQNSISEKEVDPWQAKFNFHLPGFNLRPLEMSGAVGLAQLSKLPSFLEFRRSNAKLLSKGLNTISGLRLQSQFEGGSWMAFAVNVDPTIIDRSLILEVFYELGIETRPVVAGNFLQQPVMNSIKDKCIIASSYPGAERIHSNSFMFANHGRDMKLEISELVNRLQNLMKQLS